MRDSSNILHGVVDLLQAQLRRQCSMQHAKQHSPLKGVRQGTRARRHSRGGGGSQSAKCSADFRAPHVRPFDAVDAVDAARAPPPPAPSSAAATSKYPWTAPGDDCCKHKAVWSALFVVAGDAFCAWMSSTRSVVHRKGAVPRFLGSSSSIIVIIERSLPRYCTCHGGGMVYLTTVDSL